MLSPMILRSFSYVAFFISNTLHAASDLCRSIAEKLLFNQIECAVADDCSSTSNCFEDHMDQSKLYR